MCVSYFASLTTHSQIDSSLQISSSAEADDATDIAYVLARHWSRVDINRIPDDLERFVQTYPQSAPAWEALRERYGMK